jgi:uncharacterized secreted protein with C-terminal beta-propeller domain
MSDEIERRLRAARPHTKADDGWADSPDGDRTLDAIRRSAKAPRRRSLATVTRLPGRPALLGLGLTAAATVAVTLAVTIPSGSRPGSPVALPPSTTTHPPTGPGVRPSNLALVAYDDCDAALSGLRKHAAAHVSAYQYGGIAYGSREAVPAGAPMDSAQSAAAGSAPDHSTTNVQEAGIDEPDLVETDGKRVVSVSGGVLRVTDVASHEVTGSLDLSMYSGADAAQLLMSGDRVLVLLGGQYSGGYYGGGPMIDSIAPYPQPSTASSGYLLVDLSGSQPSVVSTLHAKGGFVDARMVDGTVRLVVQSAPRIQFPVPGGNASAKEQLARNREAVAHTPLSAWLPSYDVTAHGATTSHTVACRQVSHPANYTGASMLTVYTIDLAGDLKDLEPVSLAADGTTVYASASSLYVASSDGTKTQIHRFDISGAGRPTYLGSGSVPGSMLNSYSMSEYDGSLRAVTTTDQYYAKTGVSSPDAGVSSPNNGRSTSVYVLDAAKLTISGHVGGLGRNEQVHAVRFLGPLAYVVTFESVDPLYVLDLHDPAHPRQTGELVITGYSDYLHQTGPGRLLGVGQDVNSNAIVNGLQVSLFDVSDLSHPRRLDRVVREHTPGEDTLDPHAFLYWPATKTAVVPIHSWDSTQSGAVLVLHVGTDSLRTIGLIRNPAVNSSELGYNTGIERTMMIGESIWTMSSSGLAVSNASTLTRQAWIPFS